MNNLKPIKPENISPQDVVPSMNVDLAASAPVEEKNLITDEQLLGVYGEIMTDIRKDKNEVDEILTRFVDMVFNEGEPTSASKEALVNLLKMKTDQSDKMTRIADLMTRLKLKERDTFPRYMAAQQNNTINIGDGGQKRAILEALDKAKKGVKKDDK